MGATRLHSPHKESFHVMLNLKASFKKGNLYLNEFCMDWRAKRKAKSGGINGNHRQLWYFLLSILPHEMDDICDRHKMLFDQLDYSGHYALFTNRKQLLRLMTDTEKGASIRPSLTARTINNLIDRLIEAKLILKKVNFTSTGTFCRTGQGNFLLVLNGQFIEKYSCFRLQPQKLEKSGLSTANLVNSSGTMKKLQQPSNSSIEQVNNINNSQADVDKSKSQVFQGYKPKPKRAFSTSLGLSGTLKDVQQPSNSSIEQINNINNSQTDVDKVKKGIINDGSSSKPKQLGLGNKNQSLEKNSKSAKSVNPVFKSTYLDLLNNFSLNVVPRVEFQLQTIWDLARQQLWEGKVFNSEVNRVVLELIKSNYDGLRDRIRKWRVAQLDRYRKSEKYKALSKYQQVARERYLQEMYLPKVEKTAFEIICAAIRIQAKNAKKKGYVIYYPTVYFSRDFGFAKAIQYAEKEWFNMRRLKNSKRNDRIVQIAKLKQWVSRIIANVYETKRKEGWYRALVYLDKQVQKLREQARGLGLIGQVELEGYIQSILDTVGTQNS